MRTAVADAGPIEAVITATGTVVPEVEQVVSSPVDARVLRILKRTGATLKKGDPLVTLDISETQLAVDKLAQDLAIKENQQARTRLSLEKSLIDLNGQVEVKTLQLASLRSQLARDRQLAADGLLSQELLKKSELAVSQAQIELKQLEGSRENARVANGTEVTGLGLEMSKLQQEQREARRLLDLATPRADRDGVLTWALTQEGVGHPEGRRHRARGRSRLVPRRGDRLRRARRAAVRGLAGHGQGERRHARGHGRRRAADDSERGHHAAGRAEGSLEPAAAIQSPRRRGHRHGQQAARRAHPARAVRHGRRCRSRCS